MSMSSQHGHHHSRHDIHVQKQEGQGSKRLLPARLLPCQGVMTFPEASRQTSHMSWARAMSQMETRNSIRYPSKITVVLAGRHLPPEQLLGRGHPGLPARSHPLEDALDGEMHRVCVCVWGGCGAGDCGGSMHFSMPWGNGGGESCGWPRGGRSESWESYVTPSKARTWRPSTGRYEDLNGWWEPCTQAYIVGRLGTSTQPSLPSLLRSRKCEVLTV